MRRFLRRYVRGSEYDAEEGIVHSRLFEPEADEGLSMHELPTSWNDSNVQDYCTFFKTQHTIPGVFGIGEGLLTAHGCACVYIPDNDTSPYNQIHHEIPSAQLAGDVPRDLADAATRALHDGDAEFCRLLRKKAKVK